MDRELPQPILSYLILSYSILSYPISFYLILSQLVPLTIQFNHILFRDMMYHLS